MATDLVCSGWGIGTFAGTDNVTGSTHSRAWFSEALERAVGLAQLAETAKPHVQARISGVFIGLFYISVRTLLIGRGATRAVCDG
jgi:hypothetical protein